MTIDRNPAGKCVSNAASYCWLPSLTGESASILFTLASDRGQRPLNS